MKRPCVYLLASGRNGTLYVGVTSGLTKRLFLHREDVIGGFTQKYGVHRLVWFEEFEGHADRHNTRKADQEVESCMEIAADRKPAMA